MIKKWLKVLYNRPLTVELTDLATEITKYANIRTHIRKIINNYFKYTNTRCNVIEYRSFYLVVLLLASSSRFWNINDSTRSRLDYILYVSIRALVPKNINWWTFAKILTVMSIFSLNSTISNHIASDSPSRRIKS